MTLKFPDPHGPQNGRSEIQKFPVQMKEIQFNTSPQRLGHSHPHRSKRRDLRPHEEREEKKREEKKEKNCAFSFIIHSYIVYQ